MNEIFMLKGCNHFKHIHSILTYFCLVMHRIEYLMADIKTLPDALYLVPCVCNLSKRAESCFIKNSFPLFGHSSDILLADSSVCANGSTLVSLSPFYEEISRQFNCCYVNSGLHYLLTLRSKSSCLTPIQEFMLNIGFLCCFKDA